MWNNYKVMLKKHAAARVLATCWFNNPITVNNLAKRNRRRRAERTEANSTIKYRRRRGSGAGEKEDERSIIRQRLLQQKQAERCHRAHVRYATRNYSLRVINTHDSPVYITEPVLKYRGFCRYNFTLCITYAIHIRITLCIGTHVISSRKFAC